MLNNYNYANNINNKQYLIKNANNNITNTNKYINNNNIIINENNYIKNNSNNNSNNTNNINSNGTKKLFVVDFKNLKKGKLLNDFLESYLTHLRQETIEK